MREPRGRSRGDVEFMGPITGPACNGTGRGIVDIWPTAVDWSMEREGDAHTGRHSSSPPLQSTAASKGADSCFLAADVSKRGQDVGGEGGSSWMRPGAARSRDGLQTTEERQVEGGGRMSSSHLEESEMILKRLENEVRPLDVTHCKSTGVRMPTHELVLAGAPLEMTSQKCFHSIRP